MFSRLSSDNPDYHDFPAVLSLWQSERAYRLGKLICKVGIVLGLAAVAIDVVYANLVVVASDVLFIAGCLLSIALSQSPPKPYFFGGPRISVFGFRLSLASS